MVSTAERVRASPSSADRVGDWLRAAVVAGVLVAAVRWLLTHDRREYSIWPDEPAQLAIARFLGGGTRWNMDDHSVWRPLYGLLIAPAHWFTDDPATVLRSALSVNAVLGGIAAGLLVVLLRRLSALGPTAAGAVAVVLSLTPAVLFPTEFVWSESLTLVLYLASLLGLLCFAAQPTERHGVVAALVAGAAFGAHSRMLPVVVIVVGVAVVAVARGRCGRRVAVVTTAAAVGAVVTVLVATDWVVGRLWDEPSNRNSPGGVAGQLGDPLAIAVSAVGQVWYLLVASLGLTAIGVWVLVGAVRRGHRGPHPSRTDAVVVLLVAGASVALSIVFMADRWRSDQLVYGRYNDVAVLPVLAVGVAAWLDRPRPTRRVVAATATAIAVTGTGLWWLRRDELAASNGLEPMILGLQPHVTDAAIPVLRITVVAAAASLLLGAIASRVRSTRWTAVGIVMLCVLVAVGGVRTHRNLDAGWSDSGGASWYGTLDERLADVATVDWYLPEGSTSTKQLMLAQFHLPSVEFLVVHDPVADPTSGFVLAPVTDDALLVSTARLVAASPGGTVGLWRR
jgi:hypothetical protein